MQRTRTAKYLPLDIALNKMRTGSVLISTRNNKIKAGGYYTVDPGGPINNAVADAIKTHEAVTATDDGLLPGLSQTWRMPPA